MTVTLKHLAAALSDSHDLPKKQAEAVLGDLVTLTTRHLKKGDKIRLTGLGILQVRKRAAQPGDRRGDQDQSEQEGRLSGCQGTEGSGVDRSYRSRPLRRCPDLGG
jgi:nucleoid DNA-binding protein